MGWLFCWKGIHFKQVGTILKLLRGFWVHIWPILGTWSCHLSDLLLCRILHCSMRLAAKVAFGAANCGVCFQVNTWELKSWVYHRGSQGSKGYLAHLILWYDWLPSWVVARYLTVKMSEASLIINVSMLDIWFIFQVLEIKLFMILSYSN